MFMCIINHSYGLELFWVYEFVIYRKGVYEIDAVFSLTNHNNTYDEYKLYSAIV